MRKDFLVLCLIALFAFVLWKGTEIQTVEEFYLENIDAVTANSETVTLQIDSSAVLNNMDRLKKELHSYVELDGMILDKMQYVLRPGDTVFDIVQRATRHERIQFEYQGADQNAFNSAYIQGIQYLYEFSCGPLSGWMYEVNGEFPNKGVSQYELENGDEVVLYYTCDLGKDIGAKWQGDAS